MKTRTRGRREFLAAAAMTAAVAAHPLAAFGRAVESARQDSSPSALKITGIAPVGTLRGLSRAKARSAAIRPTDTASSTPSSESAVLYQPSRCMPSPCPAISAQPRV